VLHRSGKRVDGVRLRYHASLLACEPLEAEAGRHERLELHLREAARGAAPGQLATFMCGETIVGHGTIAADR
jgi:hypothetical protein